MPCAPGLARLLLEFVAVPPGEWRGQAAGLPSPGTAVAAGAGMNEPSVHMSRWGRLHPDRNCRIPCSDGFRGAVSNAVMSPLSPAGCQGPGGKDLPWHG